MPILKCWSTGVIPRTTTRKSKIRTNVKCLQNTHNITANKLLVTQHNTLHRRGQLAAVPNSQTESHTLETSTHGQVQEKQHNDKLLRQNTGDRAQCSETKAPASQSDDCLFSFELSQYIMLVLLSEQSIRLWITTINHHCLEQDQQHSDKSLRVSTGYRAQCSDEKDLNFQSKACLFVF